MTNLDLLHDAIETLERQELTFAVAAKLADLYIVKDHIDVEGRPITSLRDLMPSSSQPLTEFMEAVQQAGAERAWAVVDDLMSTLKNINQRLYDSVIRRLTE